MIGSLQKQSLAFLPLSLVFLLVAAMTAYTGNYILLVIPFAFLLFIAGMQSPDLVFFLLMISIPLSTEYSVGGQLSTDLPDEQFMWLISVVVMACLFYFSRSTMKQLFSHPLVFLVFAVFTWTGFTVLFAEDKLVSLKFFLSKAWYILTFVVGALIVFNNKKNIIISGLLLAGTVIIVALIILFKHYPAQFSFATINEAVKPFFRNHVNYAALLVCCVPILGAVIVLSRHRLIKQVAFLSMIMLLTALFFSYSRGAWLALLAGLVAWWLIRKKLLLISYATVMVAGLFAVLWLKSENRYLSYAHDYKTTIFHKDFSKHLVSTYKLKDLSTAERFNRWVAGIRMIKDRPLTGVGPGNFYPNYKSYTVPAFKTWVSDNPERSTVHNYFLLTIVEQGLPGLLFLLILIGAVLYFAERGYHLAADKHVKIMYIITGVIMTMVITLNFLSDLVETDKIGSLFFLCIAVIAALDSKKLKLTPDVERIPQSVPK